MTKYLALLPLLMASTAMAGSATDEGAQHLTEVFQTYLGTTEGVVSVAPNGDAYDLTLDVGPLLAMAKEAGVAAAISPIEMSLTDNGDGTWGVSQDQALSMTFTGPDKSELKEDIASLKMEGTFDEGLMTFSEAKGSFEGIKAVSTQTTPEGQVSAEVVLDKGTFDTTGTKGASGGVDLVTNASITGFTETVNAPMGEGAPSMPITVKAESMTQTVKGTGMMFDGIYKTAAWLVAHPDDASKTAAKAELKTILTEALPIWTNITGDGKIAKVSVDTPMGPVGIDEITFTVDVNGAVKEGKFREAFTVSGLTLPAGLVPDWAAPILPRKVAVDFQAAGFDAAAGITAALGIFDQDPGMADTTALDAAVKKGFFPDGTVTVSLNPGAVTGDGYELAWQGDMTVNIDSETPSGKAVVTLVGADKLKAAMDAAPDDMKMQAMMGFGMAEGMAKKDGDKLVWEIDATNPADVKINGTSLMGGQ